MFPRVRFRLPDFRRPSPGARAAARALFRGAAPFARRRGAAAIVERDGTVVAANGAAWDLASVLGLAEAAPLRREIAAAISAGRPQVLPLASDDGTLVVEVLPLGNGAALVLGQEAGAAGALNQALADSRARYKALVEMSSEFAWETGPDGRFAFVSPRGALGWSAEELVGRTPQEFMTAPLDASPFAAREPVDGSVVWWRRRDGTEACLSVVAAAIERNGRWRGARGVCRDVTAERAHEDALARARQREDLLAHLVRLLRDAEDTDAMLAGACETATRALGARACRIDRVDDDGATERYATFGPAGEEPALTLMIARAARSGGGVAIMDSGSGRSIACPTQHRHAVNGVLFLERAPDAPPWSEEDRMLVVGIADQLGIALAQAVAQAALNEASRTDPLTGLLNRRAFEAEMAGRLARNPHASAPGALLAIDLDDFKSVNDDHGHEAGDEALKAVAALLIERTRPGDLVARLGGDEFAIWLDRIDQGSVAARAGELVGCASRLAEFSGSAGPLGLSVGVAVRGAETDLASLMARADAAMYVAKRGGKGGYQLDGATTSLVAARQRRAARA